MVRGTKRLKNEGHLQNLRVIIELTNVFLIVVSEGEEKGTESFIKRKMENFTNQGRGMDNQIHESQTKENMINQMISQVYIQIHYNQTYYLKR